MLLIVKEKFKCMCTFNLYVPAWYHVFHKPSYCNSASETEQKSTGFWYTCIDRIFNVVQIWVLTVWTLKNWFWNVHVTHAHRSAVAAQLWWEHVSGGFHVPPVWWGRPLSWLWPWKTIFKYDELWIASIVTSQPLWCRHWGHCRMSFKTTST